MGQIVASGLALARVTAVGAEGYAARLTAQAKVFTKTHSDLQDGINRILLALREVLKRIKGTEVEKLLKATGAL